MQRPIVAVVDVLGPFQVQTRPWTLKPRDRKAIATGPKVRVESVHLSPDSMEIGLTALVNGLGLRDTDRNGRIEQNTNPTNLWLGTWTKDLALEFELPEALPVMSLEVWNYNAEWQTSNGLYKADVAISANGKSWKTIQKGVTFNEADGTPSYDEPTVIDLKGSTAKKVRLQNLVPLSANAKIGLSEVIVREAVSPRACPLQPADGSSEVALEKVPFEWVRGWGAIEHQLYLGTSPDTLALNATTTDTHFEMPKLRPGTTYYWRVDEVQKKNKIATGRIARFETLPNTKTIPSSFTGYMR